MTGTEKVTRRRAETRRRLVETAYAVFCETGIRDTPVELIRDRAGFTRGAFYSNFASKEELFLAVYQTTVADSTYVFDVLPRLFAALIAPR
jgi:AcrR family transcriptional regulator